MMENSNTNVAGSGGAPSNSRWNPTKEQISMLESFYSQGIRTPSTEVIEQITSRLKAYGHIEGKNVFYWFQNHKARQRQKLKQESMTYVNSYLHKTHTHQPVLTSPSGNVFCSRPHYLPQSEMGFYQQAPKVLLPGCFKRRPRSETRVYAFKGYEQAVPHEYTTHVPKQNSERNLETINNSSSIDDQETLPLFPLHPTGILEGPTTYLLGSTSADNSFNTPSSSKTSSGIEERSGDDKPFFDFFSGKDPFESD